MLGHVFLATLKILSLYLIFNILMCLGMNLYVCYAMLVLLIAFHMKLFIFTYSFLSLCSLDYIISIDVY